MYRPTFQYLRMCLCQRPLKFEYDLIIMLVFVISFPGTYAILNNIYINDEVCIPQQFQPFVILSTDANKCIYTKDLCAEKGQVIFNNGTASENSRCRCDYRKGYLFVTKPQNICYCDPVQEDCACVLADCKYNKELNSGIKHYQRCTRHS